VRPCVSPRTAVIGALVSAGAAATMLAGAVVNAPPAPSAAATVQVVPTSGAPTAQR
jgi:hypothetical protein